MPAQPAVLFPSGPTIVIDYLAELVGVHVCKNIPNPRPATFVRVFRTGGVRNTAVTDLAQLTVEAWAEKDEDAEDLAHLTRAHLQALAGTTQSGVTVYRVDEFSGPVELPDPASRQSRYTWTIAVQLRGVALTGS